MDFMTGAICNLVCNLPRNLPGNLPSARSQTQPQIIDVHVFRMYFDELGDEYSTGFHRR